MLDKQSDQQKFRRLMQWAARASSQYTDNELEQFAEEYWAERGMDYYNLYDTAFMQNIFKEVNDGKSTRTDQDNDN